jgi:hypothetical protein
VAATISLPTSVDPVKDTLSTPSCSVSARPASAPVRQLTTPAGIPASRQSRARNTVVSGVCSAGLRTTVLPQASAGASFQAAIASGRFHGVISAHTPTGSRRV